MVLEILQAGTPAPFVERNEEAAFELLFGEIEAGLAELDFAPQPCQGIARSHLRSRLFVVEVTGQHFVELVEHILRELLDQMAQSLDEFLGGLAHVGCLLAPDFFVIGEQLLLHVFRAAADRKCPLDPFDPVGTQRRCGERPLAELSGVGEGEAREAFPEGSEGCALAELSTFSGGTGKSVKVDLDQPGRSFSTELPGFESPAVAEQAGAAMDGGGEHITAKLLDRGLLLSALALSAFEIPHCRGFVLDQKDRQGSKELLDPDREVRTVRALTRLVVGVVAVAVAKGLQDLTAESVDHRLLVSPRRSVRGTPVEIVRENLTPAAGRDLPFGQQATQAFHKLGESLLLDLVLAGKLEDLWEGTLHDEVGANKVSLS